MPYKILYTKNKGYKVYKIDDGKPLSNKYFKTKKEAESQMKAVIINELKRKIKGGKKSSHQDVIDAENKRKERINNEENQQVNQSREDKQELLKYNPDYQSKLKLSKDTQKNNKLFQAYNRDREKRVQNIYDAEYDRINQEQAYLDEQDRIREEQEEKDNDIFGNILGALSTATSFIPGVGSTISTGLNAVNTGYQMLGSGKINCDCGSIFHKSHLKKHLLTKKHQKHGSGVVDWIKNKVSDVFKIRNGYNNLSSKTIKDYGDWKIFKLHIYRKPIDSVLEKVLNLISLGKFKKGMIESEYDKMFHLGLFAIIGNEKGQFVNILIQKNAVIEISKTSFNISSYGENIPIVINKPLTINQLLEKGQKELGDKYFKYDAFTNNCQMFIKALLSGSNLYNDKLNNFVYQSLDIILKNLPNSTPKIAKMITNLGGLTDKLLGNGKKKKKLIKV